MRLGKLSKHMTIQWPSKVVAVLLVETNTYCLMCFFFQTIVMREEGSLLFERLPLPESFVTVHNRDWVNILFTEFSGAGVRCSVIRSCFFLALPGDPKSRPVPKGIPQRKVMGKKGQGSRCSACAARL